jgi:hypothetical protein
MKTLKKRNEFTTFFMVFVMLLQSCIVYKSVTITIDQAVQNQSEVKIHTLNNDTYRFTAIESIDGKYFGINKSAHEVLRTSFDENQISNIKEKDKTLSIILDIGIVIILLTPVIFVAVNGGGIVPDGVFN